MHCKTAAGLRSLHWMYFVGQTLRAVLMRSRCAGEFISALGFRETFIPGPCLCNCSFYPKEQDLAWSHCGLHHAESGLVAAQGSGSGVQIQWSAPDYLWQLCTVVVGCPLYRHTKIIVLLFSLSCFLVGIGVDFCIKFISLGSSSIRSFLPKTTALVPLSGKALGVCSTVCASRVRESHVQPVKLMSAGGAGVLGDAWSPSLSAMS